MPVSPSDKAIREEGLSHNGETGDDEDRRVAGRAREVVLNVVEEDERMGCGGTPGASQEEDTSAEHSDMPVVVPAEVEP